MKKKKEKLRELKSKSKEMEAQFLEKTESLTQGDLDDLVSEVPSLTSESLVSVDHLKYEANNSRLKELFQELVEKKKQIAELRKKEPPTKAAPANLEECHEMLEQQVRSDSLVVLPLSPVMLTGSRPTSLSDGRLNRSKL